MLRICKQEIFVSYYLNNNKVISPHAKRPDRSLFTASKILDRAYKGKKKTFDEDLCMSNLKLPACEVFINFNYFILKM